MLKIWNTFIIKHTEIYKAPLLKRLNYASALSHISEAIGCKDDAALSALHLFEKELEVEGNTRVKNIKWFEYRYSIFIDALYIFAFNDRATGKRVLDVLLSMLNPKYHKSMQQLFEYLYDGSTCDLNLSVIKPQLDNWKINEEFEEKQLNTTAVVAEMTAGKSTLINALVGKNINKAQNLSCTVNIRYIYNKPVDDGYVAYYNGKINFNASCDEFFDEKLENADASEIGIYFAQGKRLCLIDTPGVNYSLDKELEVKSKMLVKKGKYDKLLYIINATLIGTSSEKTYLEYIYKNADRDKLVFVLNKLDTFTGETDDIEETFASTKKYLQYLGFAEPKLFPLSAQAAYLKIMSLNGVALNKQERLILDLYEKLFRLDSFSLEQFTELGNDDEKDNLLLRSGIKNLMYEIGG